MTSFLNSLEKVTPVRVRKKPYAKSKVAMHIAAVMVNSLMVHHENEIHHFIAALDKETRRKLMVYLGWHTI